MANPIAEAFVLLRPDLSGFDAAVQRQVNASLAKVKIGSVGGTAIAAQMFGSSNFQSATRTQLASSVSKGAAAATVPPQVQRTLAQQLFGSGFRSESGRAIQGALAGAGQGQLAARFAFFGAGGAAIAATTGALLASSISAAKFEQSLNTLQATAQLTDEQLAQFSRTAKQLGADVTLPAVTAQTAADAFTELAKAGLSAEDALAAGRGVLQLATAAGTDAATAARITAAALNSFQLAGDQAVHVADLLAGASIAAQGDINDMALALQQSATVANLAGVSIETLTGIITELARRGLVGSDAGTSIRTGLLRLIPTTKEAAQIMEVLGIQIDKTKTLGQQLPQLLDQYNAAFKRLNPTTRQATLQQIAGTDAVRSLSILIQEGSAGLERSTAAANRAGAANDLASAKTKGLAGAFQGLQSSVQTLGITIGQILSPALEELLVLAQSLLSPINKVAEAFASLGGIKIPGLGTDLGDIAKHAFLLANGFTTVLEAASLTRTGFHKLGLSMGDFDETAQRAIERIGELKAELKDATTPEERRVQIRVEITNLERGAANLGAAADSAEGLRIQIAALNKELFSGDKSRAEKIAIQGVIADLEKQLEGLPAKAKRAAKGVADAFTGPLAGTFTPPLQALQADLEKTIDPNVLGRRLQKAISFLNDPSITAAAKKPLAEVAKSLVDQLAKMGPEGERVLRAAGVKITKGLAEGITSEEATAIAAAQHVLAQVRAEGEKQIQEAIRSARGNLESLGTSLGGSLDELFAAAPPPARLQRQIKTIVANVEKGLRFNLAGARRDLAQAQSAIGQIGSLTPEEKRRQQEFLAPLKQSVADATTALKDFTTDDAITEIDKLDEKIQELQDTVQKRQLRFDLTTAKQDLRDAKQSIVQFGTVTPAERRQQQEFLAPFRQRVLDAKAAADEFNLTNIRDEVADTQAAAAKAADEGIQNLIGRFEAGELSAGEFASKLNSQLAPALGILKTKAGQNLGLVFTRDFKRDVDALVQQAKALAAFFPLGGNTTPGATVVRPAETQAQVNQRIAEAAASLEQIRKDAITASKEEQDKQANTNAILRQIRDLLTPGGRRPH